MDKTKLSKNKICGIFAKTGFVCFAVSLILQVIITNKYAIKGNEMNRLKETKHELERQISLVTLEIVDSSSLASVEVKAKELGFVEHTVPIEIVGSSQFAAIR